MNELVADRIVSDYDTNLLVDGLSDYVEMIEKPSTLSRMRREMRLLIFALRTTTSFQPGVSSLSHIFSCFTRSFYYLQDFTAFPCCQSHVINPKLTELMIK